MAKPKRTRKKKQNSSKKKKRGGGNCVSQENPWLTDECKSTGKTTHEQDDDTNWDELIKSLGVENQTQDNPQSPIANNTADWNALIDAAKVANENNKRQEEETANLKIAEYIATHPSPTDRAIRRTFHIGKKGANPRSGVHRIKLSL